MLHYTEMQTGKREKSDNMTRSFTEFIIHFRIIKIIYFTCSLVVTLKYFVLSYTSKSVIFHSKIKSIKK